MAVTPVGTPAAIQRSTSGATGVTGSWGTGQNRTAGNLLVALVSAGGSTASVAAITTPSGWTQAAEIGNIDGSTSAHAWVAVYWKVAAGSDSAPSFTSTLSGTQVMTCTLLELSGCHNGRPVQAYGTASSGSGAATVSFSPSTGRNPAGGSYAVTIACQQQGATTNTNTWTPGSGWANLASDAATSSSMHTAVDSQVPATSSNVTESSAAFGTATTSFGAAIVLVIHPPAGLVLYSGDVPSTTVSSGGTTAPASGTVETWTVASSTGFPVVSNSMVPPTRYFVSDPALPSENIEVINQITSTSWLVVRGADGTTPVSHSGGFTVYQVVNAGSLGDLPQVYNVRSPLFGARGDGSTDDTAAIMLAVNTCAANGGGTVYIPAGSYKTTAALNWKINGLVVTTDGSQYTTIIQHTSNTPIVQVAGSDQNIGGLTLTYVNQEPSANTSSICMTFGDDTLGSCFQGHYYDLLLEQGAYGMTVDPSIVNSAGMFSCLFEDIEVNGYTISAISLIGGNGTGAYCTGCVFTNTYTHNNFSGTDAAATSWPVRIQYWDEITFHQLNIEHCTLSGNDALIFASVGNGVIAGLHIEAITLSGDGFAQIYLTQPGNGTKLTCYGFTSRFNVFTGAASNPVVRLNGSGNQFVLAGFEDSSNTVTTPARPFVDFRSQGGGQVWARALTTTQITTQQVNAAAGDVVAEYNDTATYTGSSSLAGLTLVSGTLLTVPAAGAVEYDGTAFYATSVASSRQVVGAEQVQVLSGTRTFTNNTSAQAIFNATANGALTVAGSTTYEFECVLNVTGLSSSSHSVNFGLALGGGASVTSILYVATSATATLAAAGLAIGTSASANGILPVGTTATGLASYIRGTIRMNAGGTITPQLTQVTASTAAVVGANSFFRCWPIGSGSVTSVGDWS